MLKLKLLAAALLGVALSLSTACSPQAKHPNQINAFDGASYDSLTVAHAALTSLRDTINTSYPQGKSAFNQAAAAYQTAFTAYSSYRTVQSDQTQTAMAISNLTVSIVDLENAFQSGMHVQPKVVRSVRQRAVTMRAATPKITISDILTELEVAATIAASVPGTQPYAQIAQVVIRATQSAVQAIQASNGQIINLQAIAPVAPLV